MYGYTFDDCYHRSIGCSIEHYRGPVVNVGRVTEALASAQASCVTSPSILAHGAMPWESRTMMVVAVQGAPKEADFVMTLDALYGLTISYIL